MQRIEQRLELLGEPEKPAHRIGEHERSQLVEFAVQLAQPELSLEARLKIAVQMRTLLVGEALILDSSPINENRRKQKDVLNVHAPTCPALLGVT